MFLIAKPHVVNRKIIPQRNSICGVLLIYSMTQSYQPIITPTGLKRAQQELAERLFARKEILESIDRARQLGDLRENSEYHEAKEQQAENETKIAELQHLLKVAQIADEDRATKQGKQKVTIGSTVTLVYNDKTREFTIVGFNEVNPAKGFISNESPLGKALLGRKKGESIEVALPNGMITYTIKEIH